MKISNIPWKIFQDDLCDGDRRTIATFHGGYEEGDIRLCSAAPDLLAAAKRWDAALPELDGEIAPDSPRAQLRAAIRKAEGKS